jgi:hypothetical protein
MATSAVAMIVPPPPSATARGARHFEAVGILKSVVIWPPDNVSLELAQI